MNDAGWPIYYYLAIGFLLASPPQSAESKVANVLYLGPVLLTVLDLTGFSIDILAVAHNYDLLKYYRGVNFV